MTASMKPITWLSPLHASASVLQFTSRPAKRFAYASALMEIVVPFSSAAGISGTTGEHAIGASPAAA